MGKTGLWRIQRVLAGGGAAAAASSRAGRQLWLRTFERNENYIEELERDLIEFAALVSSYESKLLKKAA